jgi:predicted RNA-binding protein with RPS1 domain
MVRLVAAVLVAALAVMSGPTACDKYDVPASGDKGDSAGNNQPAQKCQPSPIKAQPVGLNAAPPVYNYTIFVEVEDDNCGTLKFSEIMVVDRVGSYGHPDKFVVFDDGKSGVVYVRSPYHTGFVIEKRIPHHLSVEASITVTPEMLKAGAAWLTCRVERDNQLVGGAGQTGLARVALTGVGIYTVNCVVLT